MDGSGNIRVGRRELQFHGKHPLRKVLLIFPEQTESSVQICWGNKCWKFPCSSSKLHKGKDESTFGSLHGIKRPGKQEMAIPVCLSLFPDLIRESWGACAIHALELLFLDLEELNPIIPGAVAASKELGGSWGGTRREGQCPRCGNRQDDTSGREKNSSFIY